MCTADQRQPGGTPQSRLERASETRVIIGDEDSDPGGLLTDRNGVVPCPWRRQE